MERIPCRHTFALCFAVRATCATWEKLLVVVARVPGRRWCCIQIAVGLLRHGDWLRAWLFRVSFGV